MQLSLPHGALRAVSRAVLSLLPALVLSACSPDAATNPTVDVGVIPAGSPRAAAAVLTGAALYVNPSSHAQRQGDLWRTSRPADAAQMDKIASEPVAIWLGEWSGDVRAAVSGALSRAAGQMTVFVAYNIPGRDCGGYSAGGIGASAYRTWVRNIAAGLAGTPAVIVLEPDALAGMDCLSSTAQSERVALIADAVDVLKAAGGVVYIDAGHANWHSVEVMASRLSQAAIARADGFALNVSNFVATDITTTYGTSLSQHVGGKHFVIDVSRNGLGAAADGQWCNPPGRALGVSPTTVTGNALVDAYLWVKAPGESDGTCNDGPSAGTWWPEYALGLAQRQPTIVTPPPPPPPSPEPEPEPEPTPDPEPAPEPTPDPNQAPTASVDGPFSGDEGSPVTMSAAASTDPEGGALTYQWSFGDDTQATGMTVTRTYVQNGTYTVTLTVTDAAGASSTTTTTVVVRDVPPTATLVSPSSVLIGHSFTLSLSDASDVGARDNAAGFMYGFDCGQGWYSAWTTSNQITCPARWSSGIRYIRARVRESHDYVHREYKTTVVLHW
jgi:endoglucanase